MNKYCETCPHLGQGKLILSLFDKYAKPMFFNCPEENPHVKGCITKLQPVTDWDEFKKFLKDNNVDYENPD